MKPLRVKVATDYLFTLWFFGALNLLIAFSCFKAEVYWLASIFLVFANLCLLPMLRLGPLEANDEYNRLRLAVGCFEMGWDEIEWIELSPFETFAVLHGKKKKLVITGYSLWSGREKSELFLLFNRQIEARGVPVERKVGWDARYHCKNTRVKRDVKTGR